MKTIVLQGEKELRIYALPLRQKILREMQYTGRPMTAKEVADRLGITPSAAQHHLKQLASIGLVEADHTELIKGIQAHYLRLAPATVSIGLQYNDTLSQSRDAIAQSKLMAVFGGYMRVVEDHRKGVLAEYPGKLNDFSSGIVHLTFEQAEEFAAMVQDFFNSHDAAAPDTKPWDVALLAYRMDLAQEGDTK